MDEPDQKKTLEELRREAIRDSLWASRPVDREPTIDLVQWQIIELPDGRRHCVGYNPAWPEGRVSTSIVGLNPTTMRAMTRSGRVYILHGPPGWNADADYVLGVWLCAQGLRREDAVDVSDAVQQGPKESPGSEEADGDGE